MHIACLGACLGITYEQVYENVRTVGRVCRKSHELKIHDVRPVLLKDVELKVKLNFFDKS